MTMTIEQYKPNLFDSPLYRFSRSIWPRARIASLCGAETAPHSHRAPCRSTAALQHCLEVRQVVHRVLPGF